LRAADVGMVLLKAKELFKSVIPSKMFEIMGVGRPILITVDGEARRIVEDAGAGVFARPENPLELASALREFANDPKQSEAMGRRGRSYVERNFSRSVLARRYLDALAEVAGESAKKAGESVVSDRPPWTHGATVSG